MKALVPCTLAALAVGITTGWMLHGEGGGGTSAADAAAKGAKTEERSASPGATAAAGESSGPGEHAKSQLRVPKEKLKEIAPALDEHLEQMMANMKEQQAKRNEARIATLAEKLDLDANQQAKLREFFDKRNPATTVTKGEGGKGIKVESKMTDSPGSLDDFMKDLLSADQEGKYDEMKQTEQNQKIEARTLREMASLTQAVELRDDQRQAVYDILEKQARTDVESGTGMSGGLFMSGAAPVIELGGGVGGGAEISSNVDVMAFKVDGAADGGGNVDHAEIMKEMDRQRETSINEKVNSLAGVLDASQLAKYKQSLEQGPMLFSR